MWQCVIDGFVWCKGNTCVATQPMSILILGRQWSKTQIGKGACLDFFLEDGSSSKRRKACTRKGGLCVWLCFCLLCCGPQHHKCGNVPLTLDLLDGAQLNRVAGKFQINRGAGMDGSHYAH